MEKVYVYIHRRNDTGEIFYVGIGVNGRPYKKSSRTKWWRNIVNEHGYSVEILYERNTWDEAAVIEMMLIEKYGRIRIEPNGILINRTKGGQGTLGRPCSQETRKKIGAVHKGNTYTLGMKHTEQTKKKMSELKQGLYDGENNPMYGSSRTGEENPFYGKKHTKETKQKISKDRIRRGLSKGENNGRAKLKKEDVIWIRKNGVKGVNQSNRGNVREIAEKYGVDRSIILDILNKKTWKHI